MKRENGYLKKIAVTAMKNKRRISHVRHINKAVSTLTDMRHKDKIVNIVFEVS